VRVHIAAELTFAASLLATAGLTLFFAYQTWRHRRNLRSLPVRIHVGGTRGKSTVVRLIAAALRANGWKVLAKTTGSEPRLLMPDGSEKAWPRRGPAAIREQMRFIAIAARQKVDAIVVECMAVKPELVFASSSYLIQATHTVVTNLRPDHQEEYGTVDIGESLPALLSPSGMAFLPDDPLLQLDPGADQEIVPLPSASEPLAEAEAIARAVCLRLGLDDETITAGLVAAQPDPGAFRLARLRVGAREVAFVNAFACNDTQSFAALWRQHRQAANLIVLNPREDRPLRTRAFLDFLCAEPSATRILLPTGSLRLRWRRASKVAALRPDINAVLAAIAQHANDDVLVWGVGNYTGLGAQLIGRLGRSC
jgi:hypothetical protein